MDRKTRIWWIPNPPRKPFTIEVCTVGEAKKILNTLASYDSYLGDNLISSNAGGVEETEEGEWMGAEWYDDEGIDIFETTLMDEKIL